MLSPTHTFNNTLIIHDDSLKLLYALLKSWQIEVNGLLQYIQGPQVHYMSKMTKVVTHVEMVSKRTEND
ncbi:6485_t:CDS:2 [Gigaspora margarita]|uniref:6485_t:CDS:1 n=1 Tax=Gigaspora margarita TaxID=4874 RepID=A0ABN7V4Q1_GIGMA|nr:6485_t:CDS:2 [Gigaspora margarita]